MRTLTLCVLCAKAYQAIKDKLSSQSDSCVGTLHFTRAAEEMVQAQSSRMLTVKCHSRACGGITILGILEPTHHQVP